MKYFGIHISLIFLTIALAGCREDNGLAQQPANEDYVVADMAFSLSTPSVGVTRMSAETVQAYGNFRGITDVRIIPFAVDPTVNLVTAGSSPKLFVVSGPGYEASQRLFYYDNCTFMTGTNAALFYAKAPHSADSQKAENGSLIAYYPPRMNPSGITFSPEPIVASDDVPADAQALADYLTAVAKTLKPAASDEMKELYNNFIGLSEGSVSLLSGARNNVVAHVESLKKLLADLNTEESLKAKNDIEALKVPETNYPASLGLPDGAAVLRWAVTKDSFEVQTKRSTLADINAINHFAYPAELYYYANSMLRTSYYELSAKVYKNEKNEAWATVLGTDSLHFTSAPVSGDTKAVAILNPIQYGVANLKLKLLKTTTEILKDNKEKNEVAVGKIAEGKFPLTGIIVNGQRKVGFDFMPLSGNDENDYFVYDKVVKANSEAMGVYLCSDRDQDPMFTLLLPSSNQQKITVLLEFLNKSGQDFRGLGGIIYNNTKFYLAGVINPTLDEDIKKKSGGRVFKSDETTTLTVEVKSLANAYNVMPNLLSPRLELGVEMKTLWSQATPTSVEMY